MTEKQAKIVRIVVIVAMGLTATMNLVGGIGTTCAAFFTREYPQFYPIIIQNYQWLYQTFVVVTILIGLAGAWATFRLFRGGKNVYRNALVILLVGTVVGGIHLAVSLSILGKAVPTNVKFYINLAALIFFLVLRLPRFREHIDFSTPGDKTDLTAAGGFTAIIAGLVLLTVIYWAGPSHTYEGQNWVEVLGTPLNIGGAILLLGGLGALIKAAMEIYYRPAQTAVTSEIEA